MKDGTPATEIVYIHSKCIIIDDRVALIGSANINDRSMMGSRDSELAVVVEDKVKVEARMAGRPYSARRFAHELRKKCFKEIFGFQSYSEVSDPLSPKMWTQIHKNTKVSI